MNFISFQLVTPERTVLDQELVSLSCPTALGQITILPHHTQLVANLMPGELHAKTENEDFYLYVAGGFVEVRQGSKVIVLADTAEHYYEIDLQATEAAHQRAQKAMAEKSLSASEYAQVAAALQRNLARIRVARKHAHRKASIDQGLSNQ